MDRVVGRREAVFLLIPRRRTREGQLYGDPDQIHPAVASREDGRCAGRAEYEHDDRTYGRRTKVYDAIWQPCHDAQKRAGVGGEDVA